MRPGAVLSAAAQALAPSLPAASSNSARAGALHEAIGRRSVARRVLSFAYLGRYLVRHFFDGAWREPLFPLSAPGRTFLRDGYSAGVMRYIYDQPPRPSLADRAFYGYPLHRAVRDRLAPGSRFVTFAGSLGLEPRAHEAGPGAVNAAVFNLMRQISLLYGPRGVTTHTLSPGPADTPRLRRIVAAVAAERGAAEEDVWQEYVAQNSLGRLPTADELAWAVEMLLDPEASVLHGSVLYLDAGGHRGIG